MRWQRAKGSADAAWSLLTAMLLAACGEGAEMPMPAPSAGADAATSSEGGAQTADAAEGDGGGDCPSGACDGDACAPGNAGCACLAGTCNAGLVCQDGARCVDGAGSEGFACLPGGGCDPGTRCDTMQGRCVHCDLGSDGCACGADGRCGMGLACANGRCVDASTLPPTSPLCWTPCSSDLVDAQGTRTCGPDGLMAGCLTGRVCVQGSCLSPGETKPTCRTDVECPYFQTCLASGCYSNCTADADCAPGYGCWKKVCRQTCAQGGASCGAGMHCETQDGQSGFCTVTAPPPSTSLPRPTSGFSVATQSLTFSNLQPTGTIALGNSGTTPQAYTVTKLSHTLYEADGTIERVDAPRDPMTGEAKPCDPGAGTCPLYWLSLSDDEGGTVGPALRSIAAAGCGTGGAACPTIRVAGATDGPGVRYDGEIEVASANGRSIVHLTYAARPEGRWAGSLVYLGTFASGGVDAWKGRADKGDATGVDNALLQRWAAFRSGALDGFTEMQAVLTATRSESWRQETVASACSAVTGGSKTAVCYPYSNPAGVRVYVQNSAAAPVPSGAVELPFAIDVRPAAGSATKLVGRIDSGYALQDPAYPAVTLEFANDPTSSSACDPKIGSDCVVPIVGFAADAAVGGRYFSQDSSCDAGFRYRRVPWLLPGFVAGTTPDPVSGGRFRGECRSELLPWNTVLDPSKRAANADLAFANPVPDGRARTRHLSLLDGALVNQTQLLLLFQETLDGFIPGQPPVSAYGYAVLQRAPLDVADADFDGSAPPDVVAPASSARSGAACDEAMLAKLPGSSDRNALVDLLLDGTAVSAGFTAIADPSNQVHYLCQDTGLFDAGGDALAPAACPLGSKVRYFDVGTNLPSSAIAAEPCQGSRTCGARLDQWLAAKTVVTATDPVWRCSDTSAVLCDDDRKDLRRGKTFYRAPVASTVPAWTPARGAIDDAFRYKIRFQSDMTGTSVSFAPSICSGASDGAPYCYDPAAIEQLESRMSCLVSVYTNEMSALDLAHRTKLQSFLRESFASAPGRDGFEMLDAELLVMLGDDALAAAYGSRFDLAGIGKGTFLGSQLEPNGVDVTGVAGNELSRFYLATQYYQRALDRLYAFGPDFAAALARGTTTNLANFVSPETATTYLERLTRASTQKSRAWGEIAKRYQGFQRTDLATSVARRSYGQTYLESILMQRLMLAIAESSASTSQDAMRQVIEQAQRRYAVALTDMRQTYEAVTSDTTYFGYSREHVPFPAIDPNASAATSGYDLLAAVARQKLQLAKEREQLALQSVQNAKLDAASFQSSLVQVKQNYENQLADLCGVFPGTDGVVHPAIALYASYDPSAQLAGDPCGLMGNGAIHDAMAAVQDQVLAVRQLLVKKDNVLRSIQIERDRVTQQCNLTKQIADFQYSQAGRVRKLTADVARLQQQSNVMQRSCETASKAADGVVGCIQAGIENPAAGVGCGLAVAIGTIVNIVNVAKQQDAEQSITSAQSQISEIEAGSAKWVTEKQCDSAVIDSNARTLTMLLDLRELEVEGLRTQHALELALANAQKLAQQAQRLEAQQEESQQQLIDVEAARNDPNVRIYQNDAVINANLAFDDAIAAVYRATRVYEYYTSQSYARLGDLFLVRMISAGQPNLENYLNELDNAYAAFEDSFGLPDMRVAVLSLRDDVFDIPTTDGSKRAYTQGERIDLLRKRLADPALLDANGRLVIPFSTTLGEVSPLTRNHKIAYIETDIVGSNVGDTVARLYVRQAGTGANHRTDDGTDYYVFPARTAVVNSYFNGNRVYGPEVYRNYHLRDRPFVNTLWQLVINQRDEKVNQDIDLQSLTDIRILVYYTDFTVF